MDPNALLPALAEAPAARRAADLARAAGLREDVLSRAFSRHVGIPPKRYLGALRLPLALEALRTRPVLEAAAALDVAPSRLDALVRTHTGLSPGDWRRRGEGVDLRWGAHPTTLGPLVLVRSPLGLAGAGFAHAADPEAVADALASPWPGARLLADPAGTAALVAPVLARDGRLPLDLLGTSFQVQVWAAILDLPADVPYGALARALGRPRAARAVGQAVGANPLAWVLPCHRVVAAQGAALGYRWGSAARAALRRADAA